MMKISLAAILWLGAILPLKSQIKKQSPKISDKIYFNVIYKEAKPDDTLNIYLDNNLDILLHQKHNVFRSAMNKNGRFKFEMKTNMKQGILLLTKKKQNKNEGDPEVKEIQLIEPLFWEVGDSINVDLSIRERPTSPDVILIDQILECKFSGHGSTKYNLKHNLESFQIRHKLKEDFPKAPLNWDGNILKFDEFDSISQLQKIKLQILYSYKKKISLFSYNVLKAGIMSPSTYISNELSAFVSIGGMKSISDKLKKEIISRFDISFDYPNNYGISNEAIAYSEDYLRFLISRFKALSYLNTGEYSSDWMYNAIKISKLSQSVKELLIMMQILQPVRNAKNLEAIYNDAKVIVKTPAYVKIINQLENSVPGKKFFEFSLEDLTGNVRRLSEFKNKVVVIDFWFTGCGYCGDYYQNTLSKVEDSLKGNPNVVFLSISTDRNKSTWNNSVKLGDYTSFRSINLYTNGLGMKHPIVTKNNMQGAPFAILLDQEGRIKLLNSPQLFKRESLMEAIKELL